jgi:1-acyl-sn-glycerol-3-phosphate acyltransferase
MTLLRSALFNVVFFSVTFLLTLPATLVRIVTPDRVMPIAMLWARILVAAARVICGIRLHVEGREHLHDGALLIASRHQSAFDTFVWLTLLPRCCYVLKHELVGIPLFGRLIVATGMIAVDRHAGPPALRHLLREGERAVRERRQIVIFPEGTRSDEFAPLQPGVAALASYTRLAVIPVATDSGKCWGRRAFFKRPGVITIRIGAPIDVGTNRKVLMQQLREAMGALENPAADGA